MLQLEMLAKNLPALNLRSESKNMSFSTHSLFFLEIGWFKKKKKPNQNA